MRVDTTSLVDAETLRCNPRCFNNNLTHDSPPLTDSSAANPRTNNAYSSNSKYDVPSVCVVGAGVSGLMAAKHLS